MSRHLDDVLTSMLAQRRTQGRLRQLTCPPEGMIDFSSNDYLSLSSNPTIHSAYLEHLQRASEEGTFSLGSGGSRLLDGNKPATEALERDVASFHGAPAGLLFNSGFEANIGLFSCVPQHGDIVLYDELIHASVHDGMRLGRAKRMPFRHNSVWCEASHNEKLQSLNETLSQILRGEGGQEFRSGVSRVFIAVESVYSMDGDISPLRDIVECVEKALPNRNGCIIVDEAHSTGWMGKRGRGLVAHLGLEDRIWARVHTFGKAMGCSGAIILCSSITREYLINYARSLIYTTAISFPVLAGIEAVYDYLQGCLIEQQINRLHDLIHLAHNGLTFIASRNKMLRSVFHVDESIPQSPIIPIFSCKARSLAHYVQKRGLMIRPIVAPTVPVGTDRLRLCLHSGNSPQDVNLLCKVVESWVSEQKDRNSSSVDVAKESKESSKL